MIGAPFYRWLLQATRSGAAPRRRRLFWKRSYDLLALGWRDPGWRFMNYGYLSPETEAALAAEPPLDRASLGLYHQAVAGLPLAGARLLEIGSGRGGGAAWLARRPGVAGVVGVDLSPATVARARRLHQGAAGLAFRTGDAEALPFPAASFDAVVNIESSHCYGSMPRFLAEVARVLRPGGWFSWADLRSPDMIPALDAAFAAAGLETLAERDLTEGVLAALAAMEAQKRQVIDRYGPLRPLLAQFAGLEGSMIRRRLASGDVRYLARRCRKPLTAGAA